MELHEDDGKATPRTLLGRRLRRLREAAQLSQRALAERVGYPHTYLSRVERGEQLPSEALAQALDDYFSADGLFLELLGMAQDSLIANYSREFVRKESDAIRIQVFTSSIIPGLLQTEEYTRECFREDLAAEALNELDARVAARMKRQQIFASDSPPLYWAIIDEAAIRRVTSSKDAMCRQLEHLLQMAENPHVTIQVLPFDRALHALMGGSLILLTLKDGTTTALVESFASGEAVDSPKKVVELAQRFDVARSKALPESESLDLIRRYLKEYADES
ncbi:helix-turn-helix domain-containing protein [Streptomyces sp. YGL11-2]|uniref:helix-turn-helix domain-containing protein n=1 Tax=Streptomyces sp. YGL11-2 TaxID=3414028 RepID=UPI003CE84157